MTGEKKLKSLDEEFDFYLRFTKPLVLNKSNAEDRAHAAVWIKTLINEQDKVLRLDYLKLLLFALQKPDLIGPFKGRPAPNLEPLTKGQSILETISIFLEENKQEEQLHSKTEPRVSTAVSHDLTEYAACQEIPNFGVQCFYATSPISINQWDLSNEYYYPKKYGHGAEAWEQSSSQLYHTDLNMTSMEKNKTAQKITIDCCRDKIKICKHNIEEYITKDKTHHGEEFNPNENMEKDSRAPRSPWATTEKTSCNHQLGETPNFIWDNFSCLDSSYNIQPTSNIHEGYTLNDHGVTLFQSDQMAILLANKNVKDKKSRQTKVITSVKTAHVNTKERSLEESNHQHKKQCTFQTSYDPALMSEGFENMIACHKNDPHPSKFNLKLDENSNEIEHFVKKSTTNPNKDIVINRAEYSAQFPPIQVEEQERKTNVVTNKVTFKSLKDMKSLFEQRIPLHGVEHFNDYKKQSQV